MRVFGTILVVAAVASIWFMRPNSHGEESPLIRGAFAYAVVPPLLIAAFVLGLAFAILG